ncbi:MAG: hypothetical protein HUJ63_02595 [Enterococcus sp.]|nr:hypothetical protein [Enterococcus sp.]
MAGNQLTIAKRLMKGLNNVYGHKFTLSTKQFMGTEGQPHNYFSLAEAVYDKEKHKYYNSEIFSTCSLLRIVFYLRDIMYIEQGKELPTDQEQWNKVREELQADGKYRT